MGLLWLLWAHLSGTWRWVFVEKTLLLGAESGQHAYDLGREFVLVEGARAATLAYEWASATAGVAGTVLSNTKQQLISAAEDGDIESPRLAWLTWLTIVIATKQRPEIRVKALLQPFIVLYLTAMAGGAQYLPHMMVGALLVCRAGAGERREREQYRSAAAAAAAAPAAAPPAAADDTARRKNGSERHGERATLPTGEVPTQRFKSQTECSICLESLSARPTTAPRARSRAGCAAAVRTRLPRGVHRAVAAAEARCPLCRRAAAASAACWRLCSKFQALFLSPQLKLAPSRARRHDILQRLSVGQSVQVLRDRLDAPPSVPPVLQPEL